MTEQPIDSSTPPATTPPDLAATALKRSLAPRAGQPSWTPLDTPENALLLENWLFRLRRERFQSRTSGRSHDYYVMHLADAVSVIAITPRRQLVFVRQFRAGSRRESLEIPGGLLEPGEDPVKAGERELLEETGYTGDPPYLLGTVWSNPSLTTSRTTFLVITNAIKTGPTQPDPSEELTTELIHARRVPQLIATGQIDHASILYFRVDDLRSAYQDLEGRGVVFLRSPELVARMPDHDLWLAFFKDPDNHVLALMSEVRGVLV